MSARFGLSVTGKTAKSWEDVREHPNAEQVPVKFKLFLMCPFPNSEVSRSAYSWVNDDGW